VTLARLWAVRSRSRHVAVPLRGGLMFDRGGEALGRARRSPPSELPLGRGLSLGFPRRALQSETGLQAAWAFDLVMMAPSCPARARTWDDLFGVDVGPHSLRAFLVDRF
jgi:hypothetical protein